MNRTIRAEEWKLRNLPAPSRTFTDTIKAFNEVLSDCTPDELLGAKAIDETLADARTRMEVLETRMRKRLGD